MEYNPRKVFYRLFGQGDTRRSAGDRHETGSILDYVTSQAAALQRSSARARPGDVDDSSTPCARSSGACRRSRQDSEHRVPDAPLGVPEDFEAHLKLIFDMMALA